MSINLAGIEACADRRDYAELATLAARAAEAPAVAP
jgi:hypothetical protein